MFTFRSQRAYMAPMALPAIQKRLDLLAVETKTRSQDVSREAEIVSFTMAKLIRHAKSMVEALGKMRLLLLSATPELRSLFDKLETDEAAASDIVGCAEAMAKMKRFRSFIHRPYFADADGGSLLAGPEALAKIKASTVDDGRYIRRRAHVVRDAVDDVERQRQRFATTVDDLCKRFDIFVKLHFEAEKFERAYVQALASESIKRFPVVNAYLAK